MSTVATSNRLQRADLFALKSLVAIEVATYNEQGFITDRVRSTRECYVLTRVCPSTHPSVCPHLGGYPGQVQTGGGGYPSQVQAGGTPARSRQGVPQPGPAGGYPTLGTPHQTWPGGYPTSGPAPSI